MSPVGREVTGQYCLNPYLYNLNIQSVFTEMSPVSKEVTG